LRDHARRRLVLLVVACLALSTLSLMLPWSLAFDPWAWVTWGRDLTRFELNTAGGPSWKPLPVVATTPLALTGALAPAAWLVVARTGGLLAVAGAAFLANRLIVATRPGNASARTIAAVATAATIGLSTWWLFNSALGNSEGLLVAAALWAVVAQLAGRWRAALALGVAAALLRPETWPFLGFYALWLWRTRRARLGTLALALAPVPLLWFAPALLGAAGALGASDSARGTASPQSAVHADFPAMEVLVDFAELVTLPVLLAAFAGVALGGRRARALGAGALAWVALVAVMTHAGYAGNPRYNVVPAAVTCMLAGIGVAHLAARLARRHPDRGATAGGLLATGLAVATLAFTASDVADQIEELGARADRREDLDRLVDRTGADRLASACPPVRTNQPMKAMVGWTLDLPMDHLADPVPQQATVLASPLGYDGGPILPAAPSGRPAGREGDWTVTISCPAPSAWNERYASSHGVRKVAGSLLTTPR
jgi:hypothetical protein